MAEQGVPGENYFTKVFEVLLKYSGDMEKTLQSMKTGTKLRWLNENGLYKPIYLNAWSPLGGTV